MLEIRPLGERRGQLRRHRTSMLMPGFASGSTGLTCNESDVEQWAEPFARTRGRLRRTRTSQLQIAGAVNRRRSEEHTSELQSQSNLVCRLLLEKKKHQH